MTGKINSILGTFSACEDFMAYATCRSRKFDKHVECFCAKHIIDRQYSPELTVRRQMRLQRFREGLFAILSEDGIPWINKLAERATATPAVETPLAALRRD